MVFDEHLLQSSGILFGRMLKPNYCYTFLYIRNKSPSMLPRVSTYILELYGSNTGILRASFCYFPQCLQANSWKTSRNRQRQLPSASFLFYRSLTLLLLQAMGCWQRRYRNHTRMYTACILMLFTYGNAYHFQILVESCVGTRVANPRCA